MTLLSVFANSYVADGALAGWSSPANVYADDGIYATKTAFTKNVVYGNLFGFDLSALPDGATINSVNIYAEWHNSAADTNGPVFTLGAKSGGVEVGTLNDTSGQTTDEVFTYAPTGLTAAQLKTTGDNGFWVIVRFKRTDNTAHVAYLDYVKIEIDYTAGGPVEITGAADITVDAVGQALSGAVTVSGLSVVSFDGIGAGITGLLAITGVGAITFDGIGASITGTVQEQGAAAGELSVTFDNIAASMTGVVATTGAASTTLDGIGITADGKADITIVSSMTFDALAGTGQGAVIITGASSNTFSSVLITTAGVTEVTGGVSKTLDGVTCEIIGAVGNVPVVGFVDGLFAGLTWQAVGVVMVSAVTMATLTELETWITGLVGDAQIVARENPTKQLIRSRCNKKIQTAELPVIDSREIETPKRDNYVSTD